MAYNPTDTFRQEAEELLSEIEESALCLGTGDKADETINQLFRAFHTIKGSGAMVGLDAVASFTHHVESMLDKMRSGTVPQSPKLAELVLKAKDHIKRLLNAGELDVSEESTSLLIAEIENSDTATTEAASPDPRVEETWLIRFHPSAALLTRGGNPAALLRELRTFGTCEVTAHTDDIPDLDLIQPELCYLSWTIKLQTAADENSIRDVFIFVEDDSKLEIERITGTATAGTQQAETGPTGGSVPQATAPASSRKTLTKESTVRVPAERLDRLVNLVGELVMNQSRLTQASQGGCPELANPVQELERLVAELRDNVLGIRMLPIGTLFGRFRRLVHDLSAELGKEVELATEGAETELDKSILDQLGDPLVHCLRNCLDHGVEPPAERVRKGKPPRARIRLSATHSGADVVISIEDDGRGIDKQAVRAKALERGLIGLDAPLSDRDIFNLILLPGFSTAAQVTNVSGRGVGMDAVKRQIDALRGSLAVASKEGKGTRVSITLPLTLAIIDGLLVQVGNDQFIIPMAEVTENVELQSSDRARNNGRNLIAVRGELVPYIDLRNTFRIDGHAPGIEKVVIVRHEEHRVGLVVDRVLGTHQTVIQSLGKFFKEIAVVSGATIMGDGRVALIMDTPAVVRFADEGSPAENGRVRH